MAGKSIRTKLMALLLLATIVPAGISLVVSYFYTKQSVTEKSIRENTRILTLGKLNLEKYFAGINQMALSIYSGINLPNSAYTTILNTKRPSSGDLHVVGSSGNSITNLLYSLYQSNREIFQIHLFVQASRQSNMLINGYFRRELNEDFVAPAAPDGRTVPFLETAHPDHRYGVGASIPNLKEGATQVFSVHYPIYRAPSSEVMANLSIDIRLRELEAIAGSMFDPVAEQLFLINAGHEALYASDASLSGRPVPGGWSALPDRASGYFAWKDRYFDGIVFYSRIEGPLLDGAAVVKLVPYRHLYGDARAITRINAGIGLLFIAIGILAAVWISFRFTTPIKKLIAFTQRVQSGQLDARVEVKTDDEFRILARKISDMTQTINDYIVKEYQLELANKTNQLKALQAQINPHFLYNALQSIATLSLTYRAPKIYDLISSLGSIMRYAMATERPLVPLQQELAHAENYLLLQQERFGTGLAYAVEAEPAVLGHIVPKMILQPVVENVFKHGFEDGVLDARVRIDCRLGADGQIVIEVTDNGRGMSSARIREAEASLGEKGMHAERQIGLRNVLQRMKLHCGESADLRLRAGEGAGLVVTLTIPHPIYRG